MKYILALLSVISLGSALYLQGHVKARTCSIRLSASFLPSGLGKVQKLIKFPFKVAIGTAGILKEAIYSVSEEISLLPEKKARLEK
jgi:hypothetical protein